MKICILPGDGIGPEIMAEAVRVLRMLDLGFEMEEGLLGGCAVDATGDPYPLATQQLAQDADAVLLGAVGGPQWDRLAREQRPESGIEEVVTDKNGLVYPCGVAPAVGDAKELAPGVWWLRMPMPFALDHINLWAIADAPPSARPTVSTTPSNRDWPGMGAPMACT